MDRRAFITWSGVTLTSAIAGCLADDGSKVEPISVSEPTVEQNETAHISIEGTNLYGLHISDFPEEFREIVYDSEKRPSPRLPPLFLNPFHRTGNFRGTIPKKTCPFKRFQKRHRTRTDSCLTSVSVAQRNHFRKRRR